MAHSTDNIIKLINITKCPVVVDGTVYTVESLAKIAQAAKNAGSHIRITNCDRFSVDGLICIANAGKGFITLDLR